MPTNLNKDHIVKSYKTSDGLMYFTLKKGEKHTKDTKYIIVGLYERQKNDARKAKSDAVWMKRMIASQKGVFC
jgi:hypothetical protein